MLIGDAAGWSDPIISDPLLLGVLLAPLTGPEAAPAESFSDDNIDRILSLA